MSEEEKEAELKALVERIPKEQRAKLLDALMIDASIYCLGIEESLQGPVITWQKFLPKDFLK